MAVNFSGSLVATGSIISTTGFTGSLSGTASNAATASSADDFLVRGTLTAQTINVQTITSSIDFVTGSSVNGSLLTNTHQFTGSVGVTGSLAINGVDYNSTSASFDTRITNTSSSLSTLSTNNAIASASFDTRANANSSSIVQLSGSYLTDSASFSTRVSNNSASIGAISSSYVASSASFDTRINSISSSYATTGSNKFVGDQTITGSLLVSGSTTQIGNNTLTGNTSLTGSVNISGSTTIQGTTIFRNSSTTITGSLLISGSTTQVGNNTLLGNTTLSGSIIISGSVGAKADLNLGGVLRLDPATDPGTSNLTASFLFTSASNTTTGYDLYYRQDDNLVKFKWLEGGISTGLLYGGVITYSGSTIYVSKGSGIINNLNASTGSEISPVFNYITWNDFTGSATYLTASQNTFIYVDNTGVVRQQPEYFNPDQFREALPLGRVTHANYTSITGAGSNVQTTYDSDCQQNEFIRIFGPIKESGLLLSAQTGSMSLSIGAGQAYNLGGFYPQDPNHPSHYVSNGFATASIARAYRSGSAIRLDNNNGAFYTTVDSTNWDDGTGVLNSMSSGDWQIQRVFVNPVTGRTVVYYGQAVYSTLLNALQYLPTDPFEEGEFTAKSLVFVGYLVIKGNTTDLTDTGNNSIIQSGIFRGTQGSSGGAIVSTTLDSLSDVVISTPSNGQALIYNGGIWINGNPASASFATSASYAITSSFSTVAISASYFSGSVSNAVSSSYANTASYAVTASYVLGQSPTASHALTASSADNFLVRGTLTAQTINAQTVSSSIVYSSGSNIFGDATSDNHQFTGSVLISGSLITSTPITGSSITGSFTGSLKGIASQASLISVGNVSTSQDYSLVFAPSGANGYLQLYTDSASDILYNPNTNILQAKNIVALNSISGSLTGSLTGTASYATQAITASFVTTAQTASYVLNAVSASFATNATGAFVQGGNSFGVAALIGTNDAQNLTLETNNTNRIFISSSGYTGIGGITTPATTIPEAKLDVNGIIRARSGFQIMGNGLTTVISSSRSDNTAAGILTFNGWGDYAFNKSLLIGYDPQISGYGTGNLYVSNKIGIAKSSSNAALDVNGNAIITGSLNVTNGIVVSFGITGSLQGTATTASYVLNAVSSSFATTSSYVVTAQTASYVLNAVSSSRADSAATASSVNTLVQDVTITGSLIATGTLTANGNLISANSSGDEGGEILLYKSQTNNTLTGSGVTIDIYQNRLRFFEQGGPARGAYLDISTLGAGVSTNLLGSAVSASYATTASYVLNAVSSSFASTASYVLNAVSSSFASTASYALNAVSSSFSSTSSYIQNAQSASYVQTAQTASYVTTAQTASYVLNATSASYAATSSYANNLTVAGTLTAQTINVQTITSSIEFNTGSTRNGSLLTNTHQFTGSVGITGSLTVNAPLTITNNSSGNGLTFGSQNWYVGNATANLTYNGGVGYAFTGNANTPFKFGFTSGNSVMQITGSSGALMLQNGGTYTDNGYRLQIQPAVSGTLWVSGSSVFSGSVISTLGFTGSLQGTATTASYWNDSDVVHKSGNETIAGWKTFSGFVWITPNTSVTALNVFNSGTGKGIEGGSQGGNGGYFYNNSTSSAALVVNNQNALGPIAQFLNNSFNPVVLVKHTGIEVTGSLQVTAGITGSLQGTATTASYVLNAVSSSFASTSSYANNFVVGGTLTFDGTLTDYETVASSIVGSNNLFTKATGSYTSAFIKYTVTSGSNARSGEVMTVWNGTTTQYVDNSTLDIGNTSPVVISTSIVTSQIQINATTSTSGWKIKAIGTFI